ncbi:MAG: alkaline phosphatase family protein [Verrucomicrobia bacterium]|nr:alkaline phosphatase family protein [Verrucomicrobiota bacterium]MBU1733665.1 alkaline phosphatase family protein [Verrucomicrobiota bacterium]MBU1901919.1 alkaline phosphatase family protein [Patescibacteria group bacterium]
MKKKIIMIGDDGMIPELLLKFKEKLPNLSRLMKNGVFAPAMPSPPVDTPTNWTTIATGAWTKTHGIRGFAVPVKGKPLDVQAETFNSFLCNAEYFWEAAERQGKKSILLSYPTAWPFRTKKSIIVGGDGPFISNQWCFSSPQYYYASRTKNFKNATRIYLRKAQGWANLPSLKSPALETYLPLTGGVKMAWTKDGWKILGKEQKGDLYYCVLLLDRKGNGYDEVVVSKKKDYQAQITCLKEGEWSDWIAEEVPRKGKGNFKIKIDKLLKDGKELGIFRTAIDKTEGWCYPKSVGGKLTKNIGPFHQGLELNPFEGLVSGWGSFKLLTEAIKMQCAWMGRAAAYLTANYDWDILFMQVHVQDAINHRILSCLHPQSEYYKKNDAKKYWQELLATHRLTDELVGKVIRNCADKNTIVAFISDHGAIPVYRQIFLEGEFIKRGLIRFRKEKGKLAVDWRNTKVWNDGYNCWVNLRSRQPEGAVAPKDYEKVRDEIISILLNLRDPVTKECPVAFAARREDTSMFGISGERVGDVVYFMKPGYWNLRLYEVVGNSWEKTVSYLKKNSIYGPAKGKMPARLGSHEFLPGAQLHGFSNKATFILSGPGVPKGKRIDAINLVDVVPTLAHLIGISPPRQSEGVNIISRYLQ